MTKNNKPLVLRGEVWYADLTPCRGSEQGGLRPVLILQNDMGNKHAPTTIVAPITTRLGKKALPTHVYLDKGEGGLTHEGLALLEQIRVIDKQRLTTKLGAISLPTMDKIEKAIKVSLAIV